MEIENEKGILDLEPGSAISIERTNPLLSEQGSMSLPYSVKRTSKNDYLLSDPQKYERMNVFVTKQPMHIRAGMLSENATFEMLSMDQQSIEGVFYLYESSFYNRVKQVKLPTVFEGIERYFPSKDTRPADRLSYMLDMFEEMIRSEPDYSGDFTIFPVASECELKSRADWGDIKATTVSQKVMNEVYTYTQATTGISTIKLKAKEKYEYTDDSGNRISIPPGYGVSPFLRLGYVLRKIFEYFDLTLEPTIFETDNRYRRLVIVNNTQDAIMGGCMVESQLVPDCTINEFLDIIREGMCGDFVIDVPNKTAKLVFFKDVVNDLPDEDLSEYITSAFEKIEFATPKQVKLSTAKGLPHTDTATDTLEEFIAKYDEYNSIRPIMGEEGIYPFYTNNCIWKLSEPTSGWISKSYKTDYLSSMNFDYCTSDSLETEDHTLPFETPVTLPLMVSDNNKYPTMIIGTMRNLASHVILDGEVQAEEATQCPIILAIEGYLGVRIGVVNSDDNPSVSLGVTHPFIVTNSKDFVSIQTWSKNGLFNSFWKEYDTVLRKSFIPITYIARLPARLLQNFRFDKLKLINGQPMMPMSLQYEMTDKPYVMVEMQLNTVKKYGEDATTGAATERQELNFFVGEWSMAVNTQYLYSSLHLVMRDDYSGTVQIKYKNLSNYYVQLERSFDTARLKVITENGLTYKLIEFVSDELTNIQFYIIEQQSSPTPSFRLLNEELPVVVQKV